MESCPSWGARRGRTFLNLEDAVKQELYFNDVINLDFIYVATLGFGLGFYDVMEMEEAGAGRGK